MSVLVTGATGVVGGAVLRHLVDEGRAVRALSRSVESDTRLEEAGAEPHRGDILDIDALTTAMGGCEVVYHLAGVNTFCVADSSLMRRANIDGSRTVVEAGKRAGIGRLIYTSSAATLGEPTGTVGDEDSPHRGRYLSEYERSKHDAERAVLGDAGDLDVVIVNPSSVQGPGRATGTGRLIIDLINGKLPALVETRLSIVDIDDCARGHLLAERHGAAGRRYVLNGFTLEMREAVDLLGSVVGRSIDVRFVPGWVASAGATAIEAAARMRRTKPSVCREMVRTMLHGHAYDGSRASRELGLEYTPAEVTLRRLVEWAEEEGLVRL